MTDLLLITDVARLRKVFSKLAKEKESVRLRIANSLEKGGEEIAAEKPAIVFVQPHLSGLSADIILMHLKKQLGRRRTRFILLLPSVQATNDVIKPFHGWVDISLDDENLLKHLKELISDPRSKPRAPAPDLPEQPVTPALEVTLVESSALLGTVHPVTADQQAAAVIAPPLFPAPIETAEEPTLESQGITYAPRQRLSVYSEFNSNFDQAVSSAPQPEPVADAEIAHDRIWSDEQVETVAPRPTGSQRFTFLAWTIPVLIAVLLVTFFQYYHSVNKSKMIPAPDTTIKPPTKPVTQAPVPPSPPLKSQTMTQSPPVTAPPAGTETTEKKALSTVDTQKSTREKQLSTSPAGSHRPSTLPDYVPKYGYDKKYSATNPGWERYMGQVTEFKVYREGKSIKAIQVVDRGGNGIPESFMKGVLLQAAKNPSFAVTATERKDGYEIQRGQVNQDLKVVYYRDEQGSRLRAFVMTWN